MSVYIRTKDGRVFDMDRCLDSDPTKDLIRFAKEHKKGGKQITIATKNVIKTSLTIFDICDRFIIKYVYPKNDGKIFSLLYDSFENLVHPYFLSDIKNGNAIIYGGVWTDKGLIYVAKMNNKGGLELL